MGDDGEEHVHEVDSRVVEEIKRLRQRAGVKSRRATIDLSLFGATDWDDLEQILNMAIANVEPFSLKQALAAALNLNVLVPSSTLTDQSNWPNIGNSVIKRREWMSAHVGVSMRTLERREEIAIPLLAYQLRRLVTSPQGDELVASVWSALNTLGWVHERTGVEVSREWKARLREQLVRLDALLN